jgi:hypothetical protein
LAVIPVGHILMSTNLLGEQGQLFGHLVSRFSTHPENLATEALAFIVNRSATMRVELRNLFGRTGIELPPLARFQSQAADEQGNIPDLIGLDALGAEWLFIENKFWAGLTENQPAGYLGLFDTNPLAGRSLFLSSPLENSRCQAQVRSCSPTAPLIPRQLPTYPSSLSARGS